MRTGPRAFGTLGIVVSAAVLLVVAPSSGQTVKITPLGSTGGKVNAGSKTRQFIDLVKDRVVHLPLSGKTMEFDGQARCTAGC